METEEVTWFASHSFVVIRKLVTFGVSCLNTELSLLESWNALCHQTLSDQEEIDYQIERFHIRRSLNCRNLIRTILKPWYTFSAKSLKRILKQTFRYVYASYLSRNLTRVALSNACRWWIISTRVFIDGTWPLRRRWLPGSPYEGNFCLKLHNMYNCRISWP